MPRPRSLRPDHLASGALAVIDRDGLAGLTMRATAKELGLSTMALYRYVTDRDELELLVAEWILRDLDTTPPPGAWPEKIKDLAHRVRREVSSHPQAVPLLIANRQRARPLLRWTEAVLTVLAEAGFDGVGRVVAMRALSGYLSGALLQEHLGPLTGAGTRAMAALPAADFPLLHETATVAGRVPPDDEFAGGLAILLRGLSPGKEL